MKLGIRFTCFILILNVVIPAAEAQRRSLPRTITEENKEQLVQYVHDRLEGSSFYLQGSATIVPGTRTITTRNWLGQVRTRTETLPLAAVRLYGPEKIYFGTETFAELRGRNFQFDILLRFHEDDLIRLAQRHEQLGLAGRDNYSQELSHLLASVDRDYTPCFSNDFWQKFVTWSYTRYSHIPIRVRTPSYSKVVLISKDDWARIKISLDNVRTGSEPEVQASMQGQNLRCHIFGPESMTEMEQHTALPQPMEFRELSARSPEWLSIKGLFQRSLLVANHTIDPRMQATSDRLMSRAHIDRDTMQPKQSCRRVRQGGRRVRQCSPTQDRVEVAGGKCFRAIRQEVEATFHTTMIDLGDEANQDGRGLVDQLIDPDGETGILPGYAPRGFRYDEAKLAGLRLAPEGFVNLFCVPEFRPYLKTAYHAPINSLLVYRPNSNIFLRNRNYGHIEQRVIYSSPESFARLNARASVELQDELFESYNSVLRARNPIQRQNLQGFASDYFCPLARNGNKFSGNGLSGTWTADVDQRTRCVMEAHPSDRKIHGIYVF